MSDRRPPTGGGEPHHPPTGGGEPHHPPTGSAEPDAARPRHPRREDLAQVPPPPTELADSRARVPRPPAELADGRARVPPPPAELADSRARVPPPPAELADGRARGGRLHPAVMAIWPLSQVLPLVVLLFAGARGAPAVALAVVLVSALTSVVRYLRFSWRVEDDALVIEQGLLQRQRRVIPLERIQSVDLSRKLRHRLFGVVEVRVEAIGGSSTEGRLDALDTALAGELRRVLLREQGRASGGETSRAAPAEAVDIEHSGPEAAESVLARVGARRLVTAGLTGGRVGVVAALLGFLQQVFAERLDELLARVPQMLGLRGLLAVVVLAVLGAFVLSVAATVVAYWDFTLTREGATLRIRRGLLEQRLETLPLRRLQALRVEENLVRRLFGLAAVKADVAGRAGNEGRDTGLLLPLGSRAAAFALVERILEQPGVADVALTPMPARARTRRFVRAGLVVVVLGAAGLIVTGPVGLWALGLVVVALPAAELAYRALGHAEPDGFVVARAGLLVQRTAFVPEHRLQTLALTATPIQRGRRLATLELQIARSPGVWPGPRLIDLDAGEGAALEARLAAVMASGEARRRATEASSPLAV